MHTDDVCLECGRGGRREMKREEAIAELLRVLDGWGNMTVAEKLNMAQYPNHSKFLTEAIEKLKSYDRNA